MAPIPTSPFGSRLYQTLFNKLSPLVFVAICCPTCLDDNVYLPEEGTYDENRIYWTERLHYSYHSSKEVQVTYHTFRLTGQELEPHHRGSYRTGDLNSRAFHAKLVPVELIQQHRFNPLSIRAIRNSAFIPSPSILSRFATSRYAKPRYNTPMFSTKKRLYYPSES